MAPASENQEICPLLVYDDGQGCFGPMTHTRAVFLQRYSSQLALERIERLTERAATALVVPDPLVDVTRLEYPNLSVNTPLPSGKDTWLLVNGRWPGFEHIEQLQLLGPGQAILQNDRQIVAASLTADQANAFIASGFVGLPDEVKIQTLSDQTLLERPWQMFDILEPLLVQDLLASELPLIHPGDHPGVTIFGRYPVRVGAGTHIMPSVVIDSDNGPVVIGKNATINALSILQGPCYVGNQAVLVAHASVRRSSIIGPRCKIGGEIAFCSFHSLANKVHAGFVGNCFVGRWSNLGGNTNVSNLKNTYGNVRMQLEADREAEDTGRQFQGPVIGDYVRTGIGSHLTTGSVFGTGTMFASSHLSPRYVEPFSFYTDNGCDPYDLEAFITTARRLMARRETELVPAQEVLLRRLHAEIGFKG